MPIEETYKQFIPMIKQKAFHFYCISGISFDELESEANLIFCQVLKSYDKDKGKFSSYLFAKLHYRLSTYIKKYPYTETLTSTLTFFDKEQLWELTASLSEKSQEIIYHIFNSTVERRPGKITKTSLSTFLSNQGWKRKEIKEGFYEISKNLGVI